jgi:hypothetical protein
VRRPGEPWGQGHSASGFTLVSDFNQAISSSLADPSASGFGFGVGRLAGVATGLFGVRITGWLGSSAHQEAPRKLGVSSIGGETQRRCLSV